MSFQKTYEKLGQDTLLINWPDRIDADMIREISAYKDKVSKLGNYIRSCYHAYHSLAVVFDISKADHQKIIEQIETIEVSKTGTNFQAFRIPVYYEESMAADLNNLCQAKQLSKADLIELHTAPRYMVYFYGFLPGFMYLGGLDEKLSHPRKATPTQKIAPGSVAIGGAQTGIYPTSSPGGWHVIGRTPIRIFNVENDSPCFIAPGDQIEFFPITYEEFKEIEENPNHRIQSGTING